MAHSNKKARKAWKKAMLSYQKQVDKAVKRHDKLTEMVKGYSPGVIVIGTGHTGAAHIAAHQLKRDYDLVTLQNEWAEREQSFEQDVKDMARKYRQEGHKGIRSTPVARMSGTDNSALHKDLAQVLELMASRPSENKMFNMSLTMPPINKRGKHIRPVEVYLHPNKGHVERITSIADVVTPDTRSYKQKRKLVRKKTAHKAVKRAVAFPKP